MIFLLDLLFNILYDYIILNITYLIKHILFQKQKIPWNKHKYFIFSRDYSKDLCFNKYLILFHASRFTFTIKISSPKDLPCWYGAKKSFIFTIDLNIKNFLYFF